MPENLLFWKARPDLALPAADIARELNWGEEVEGLMDLPVKEIIDRLKQEFPNHEERPGSLTASTPAGESWEATWGWQFFKVELREPPEGQPMESARERIEEILAGFGCGEHEVP
jgi:hypothetical protein